ncbi:MAG TPA: thiamine pyrophosphate-dependent enzyme [Stellaceae bacterium]|nr:thiamine pyrophosphate-dependent enzyme [Stellaceae bacterium]
MGKKGDSGPNRRNFLAGAMLGGAAAIGGSVPAGAQDKSESDGPEASKPASPVTTPAAAAKAGAAEHKDAGQSQPITVTDAGSDYMVDVLKTLDLDYVTVNPGGSIRGLHESIIHYGQNKKPELISVMHEEIGVAICHGYARAANKPMMALIYGVLGVQHAAMAVYNAWADRVPIYMLAGNVGDQAKRFGPPSWYHSATDLSPLLSGALKWADRPVEAAYVADSLQYAYRQATTAPKGPVLVTLDDWLQENSLTGQRDKLPVPPYHPGVPPVADPAALAEAARMLVAAHYPVIVVERTVSGQAGMDNVEKLAEQLGAPVLNLEARICIGTNHRLNMTGANAAVIRQADVVLFLGVDDPWGNLNKTSDTVTRTTGHANPKAKTITIGLDEYLARGNIQDQQHAYDPDLAITGDPEASLPHLIEAIRHAQGTGSRDALNHRVATIAKQHDALRDRYIKAAAFGWDASPISVARLMAELDEVLAGETTTIVTNSTHFLDDWPQKLWNITRWNHLQANSGAGGLGFSVPAAIGAALATKGQGILPVALQTDGDFMFVSSALWTAAHHKIPLLTVMHNNRAYHAEHMNIQLMSNRRQRQVTQTDLGTTIKDPNIDYGGLARSLGMWGTGPVTDPKDLKPALQKALEVVKSGEPALVDVVTQPR